MSAVPKQLTPWVKGQSGNPGGRTKLPDDLRAIKSLTPVELCKLISKYGRMSREQVQQAVQTPSTPMIELTIAAIFAQCAKHGDYTRLAFLLDRSVGKPQDASPDTEEDDERKELGAMTDGQLLELAKKKIAEFEVA